MWSIIDASVVDLPEPVVPVRRISPRSSSAISEITGGSRSSSTVLIWKGIARQTSDTDPRCTNAFTRKRATPGTEYEKSTSRSLRKASSFASSVSMWKRVASVSAGFSGSEPSMGTSLP